MTLRTKSQCGFQERESTFWSHFCSCDLFFFYWPEWRCMDRVCVCVQFTLDGGCLFSPHPPLPMPRDPRKAEWQGSGWAKWWNDDHIMRSDSRMRGIIQRLHPSPTAMPFCCTALPAAQMMIDLREMDHRKHPLIFQCFIKNIYLQLYPKGADPTHHIPPFLNGAWYKRNNSPCSMTRLMTCNIISETSQ